MGLAASQARFLGLTARKSNVEYKGQQINQERVALSNEVMGLYNEYNRLTVPVPPSINDYQKTTYTLDNTAEGYEIQGFSKITEGDYAGLYDVTLSYDEQVPKAYSYIAKDSLITATEGANGYSNLTFQLGMDSYYYDENDLEKSTITKIVEGEYDKYPGLLTIMKSQNLTNGTYYMFSRDGVSYFTSEDDLNSTSFETIDGKKTYHGDYSFDYQGGQTVSNTVNVKAALTQDSSGRLSTISIVQSDDAPEMIGKAYSISTSQEEDTSSYTDDMNKYYYEKALYEREVERINKKTEELQEQDRSLELQLNQLDTEQLAVKTEMESISKVIEETIDSVFKTFSG